MASSSSPKNKDSIPQEEVTRPHNFQILKWPSTLNYTRIPLSVRATQLLFPLHFLTSESPILRDRSLIEYEFWKIRGWPRYNESLVSWIAKLEPEFGPLWKKLGLDTLIKMIKTEIHLQYGLIESALRFWSPSCNAFLFPWGPVTITLYDVLRITGLPVLGPSMPCLVTAPSLTCPLDESCLNYSCYAAPITKFIKGEYFNVTEEHISFLWTLICKYLFCPFSGKPTMEYLILARALHAGEILGLGVMFLGSIYKNLNRSVSSSPLSKLSGVSWFLQVWLFSYFYRLRDVSNLDLDPQDPKVLMSCTTSLSNQELINFFSSFTDDDIILPNWSFHYDPIRYPWLPDFVVPHRNDSSDVIVRVKTSCLHPRFLVIGGYNPRKKAKFAYVFYNPFMVARQFGYIQSNIPQDLFLPQPLSTKNLLEIEVGQLSRPTVTFLNSVSMLFQNPVTTVHFDPVQYFLSWWKVRYTDIFPAPIILSDQSPSKTLGKRSSPDVSEAETIQVLSPKKSAEHVSKMAKKAIKQEFPKPTKTSACRSISKPTSTVVISDEDENVLPPPGGTPHLDKLPLEIPLLQEPLNSPDKISECQNVESFNPLPQDCVSRKARMLKSRLPRKNELDLSFIEAANFTTTPGVPSSPPTDAAVSSAKITLNRLLDLDPFFLEESEKDDMLSALSVLQAIPDFSNSSSGRAFSCLSTFLDTCQSTTKKSLDTTAKVQDLKKEKSEIDSLVVERDRLYQKLALIDEKHESTERLLEKAKAEVVQYEATLAEILEESDTLGVEASKLDQEVYELGTMLAGQKEEFQRWTSTLQDVQRTRNECYAKWNELRRHIHLD